MIVDERMVSFINSLDAGNPTYLNELEEYARATDVPIVRTEMQSFLRFLMKMKQPKHSDNTKFTGVELVDFMRDYGFIKPVMLSIGPHHVSVISRYTERTENGEYKEKACRILDTANISMRKVGKAWVHESDAERWKLVMSKCRCGFYE